MQCLLGTSSNEEDEEHNIQNLSLEVVVQWFSRRLGAYTCNSEPSSGIPSAQPGDARRLDKAFVISVPSF